MYVVFGNQVRSLNAYEVVNKGVHFLLASHKNLSRTFVPCDPPCSSYHKAFARVSLKKMPDLSMLYDMRNCWYAMGITRFIQRLNKKCWGYFRQFYNDHKEGVWTTYSQSYFRHEFPVVLCQHRIATTGNIFWICLRLPNALWDALLFWLSSYHR